MFKTSTPIKPKGFSETPFHWVATPDDFRIMLDKLRQASEIAVDLEHHSYRSYAGFVCLMQVSTREEDWIIDTLVLREELGELNEVFTNPEIVKVWNKSRKMLVY
jgi:exosome complex exonuclease RRP6